MEQVHADKFLQKDVLIASITIQLENENDKGVVDTTNINVESCEYDKIVYAFMIRITLLKYYNQFRSITVRKYVRSSIILKVGLGCSVIIGRRVC